MSDLEKKNSVDYNVTDADGYGYDGASSIDTIAALVNEGQTPSTKPIAPTTVH